MELDINYLAESFSTLCGLPVRIYNNKKLVNFYSLIPFEVDPIDLDLNEILTRKDNIGYYANEFFYYYGYVNYLDGTLIIGPSREIPIDSLSLTNIAIKLGLEGKQIVKFKESMSLLIPMPLSSLMQSLATLNYVLNNKKVNISELIVSDSFKKINEVYQGNNPTDVHNTFEIERKILRYIKDGDMDSFNEFVKQTKSIRGGVLANDYVRNLKNTFIVTATLASREAISAGLEINDALNLSDLYIQQVELLNNPEKIAGLSYKMICDYINKVSKIKNTNDLVVKVNKYILNNLSSFISTNDLANHLSISRSSLCNNFKKITNKTINEYVLEYKINYAKELINDNVSFLVIAFNLGFSSQQHFTNTFKKITGITPKNYLKKKNNSPHF